MIWVTTWQNQQSECAPSEDSDQPGHPPSLIRVFAVRMKKPWVLSYPVSAQRRLIRLVLDIPRYGVELGLVTPHLADLRSKARTGRPSVRIMWFHIKCLGHDTSVRQHYRSEHWAPCRNQTQSWYDWKIVESDVEPEQTKLWICCYDQVDCQILFLNFIHFVSWTQKGYISRYHKDPKDSDTQNCCNHPKIWMWL